MENKFPYYKEVQLPGTGTYVHLVCHHFLEMVESLLTDPRISDNDYLFGDDPFAPPEDSPAMVRDLNTGQAYRTAYNKYIKDPTRQILLPIVPYMDGAVAGSCENLPSKLL